MSVVVDMRTPCILAKVKGHLKIMTNSLLPTNYSFPHTKHQPGNLLVSLGNL